MVVASPTMTGDLVEMTRDLFHPPHPCALHGLSDGVLAVLAVSEAWWADRREGEPILVRADGSPGHRDVMGSLGTYANYLRFKKRPPSKEWAVRACFDLQTITTTVESQPEVRMRTLLLVCIKLEMVDTKLSGRPRKSFYAR